MVVLNELEVNSLFCEGLFVVGFGKESTVIAKLAGLDEQHVSNRERLNFDHRSKHMPGNCRRPLSPSFYQLILQFHFDPTRRRSPSDAPVLSLRIGTFRALAENIGSCARVRARARLSAAIRAGSGPRLCRAGAAAAHRPAAA